MKLSRLDWSDILISAGIITILAGLWLIMPAWAIILAGIIALALGVGVATAAAYRR